MKKPASTGNAFDWRGHPPSVDVRSKTKRQMLLDATRRNREATVCAFVPPEHTQKIRKANI